MLRRARTFYSGGGRDSAFVRTFTGSAGLRIVGMGFGFLVGVQLARGLGPAGYGTYGIAMSVIALLMVPTEFGLPQLITREVAAAKVSGNVGLLRQLLHWANRLIALNSVIIGAIAFATVMLAGLWFNEELRVTLLWGLALLPVVAIGNIYSAALRGVDEILVGQLSDLVIRPGVVSVGLLAAILWGGGKYLTASHAMALNVLAALGAAVFAMWRLAPFMRASAVADGGESSKEHWFRNAMPMAISEGMRILAGHIAILILGATASVDEVGMYRVASGVWTVATLPSALLYVVCAPMLATLHQEGSHAAIQRLNAWMVLFLSVAAAIFIVPFAVAGTSIISTVFGSGYEASNSILMVLLFGELFSAMLGHPPTVLNMLKHDRVVARFSIYALLCNVFICLLLAPKYGAFGVAIGVAIGQVLWRLMGSWYAKRKLGLHTSVLAWYGPKMNDSNGALPK